MFRSITTLLFLLLSLHLYSQELRTHPNLIKKTLDNGFTYYLYPTEKVEGEAYFQLFVKVGSLQETEKQRGLAHFLEHMAFNGIQYFEKNDLIDFLESKGAKFGHDLNAHTSYGETIYKLQVPTKNEKVVDSTITILAGWADGILLDSTEVEKERGVVLAEWLSKQSPQRKSSLVFLDELLNGSRYADRKVIGDTAVLKSFDHRQLRNFYEKWYDPSLMAVAIAGDIDVEAVEALIIKRFSKIPTSQPQRKNYHISDYVEDQVRIVTNDWTKKTKLEIIRLIEPYRNIQTEKDYSEYLKRILLGRLIKKRFGNLSFKNPAYNDATISFGNFLPVKGAHIASVELNPDSIKGGIREFLQLSEQIYRYGFTTDEIKQVKTGFISDFKNEISKKEEASPARMIAEMHKNYFYHNKIISRQEELNLAQEYLPSIDSIALVRSLSGYNEPKPAHYLLTVPTEVKQNSLTKRELLMMVRKIKNSDIERYSNKIFVPEDLLREEPIAGSIVSQKALSEIGAISLELSNGMNIIYKQSHLDKDGIILSGFRKGGLYSLDSSQYLNGKYADPIISVSGYGAFSREALSRYLAGSSAKALMLADKTRTGFYASSTIADKEELFQLLFLKWTQPKVDPDLFTVIKKRAISRLKNKKPSSAELFGRELTYVLTGENYVTKTMTPKVLEKHLKENELLAAYKKLFGPATGFTVSVISDQPLETLKPLILKYLGGLPSGNVVTEYVYQPEYPKLSEDIEFVRRTGDSPKASVSLIFQEQVSIMDYQAVELRNEIVEDLLKNYLLQRLREDLGAVYGVSVKVNSTLHPNPLHRRSISFVCDPDRVAELVAETRKIIENLANMEEGYSEELQKIKTNLIKRYDLRKQRNSFWTRAIRDHYFDHYTNWDYVTNYKRIVQGITQVDISSVLNKYFLKTPKIKAVLYPKETKNDSI